MENTTAPSNETIPNGQFEIQNGTALCGFVEKHCDKSTYPPHEMLLLTIAMYSIVFVIWGIIALFDFINDRWSSIRKIAVTSKIHFICTLFTIPLALFYIYVQIDSKENTEMMAAVVAFFFSVYHLIRTIWGMTQLRILRRWFRQSLHIMHNQGYDLLSIRRLGHANGRMREKAKKKREENYYRIVSATDILKKQSFHSKMLKHLVNSVYLNNSIIDNEIYNMQNPIYFSFFRKSHSESRVYPRNPELCFLRWAVLYLSFYGVQFLQDSLFCRSLVLRRSGYFSDGDGEGTVRNYFAKALVTQAMLIGNGDDSRRTGNDQNEIPQEFEPAWETTWGTIVLARPEALCAALYKSTCTPFGKMKMDIRGGIYFERFAQHITRLVENLPPQSFEHKIDDGNNSGKDGNEADDAENNDGDAAGARNRGSRCGAEQNLIHYHHPCHPHDDRSTNDNANVARLIQGMSFVDVENFYIFLHSSHLHAVNHRRLSSTYPTQREPLSSTGNAEHEISGSYSIPIEDVAENRSLSAPGTNPNENTSSVGQEVYAKVGSSHPLQSHLGGLDGGTPEGQHTPEVSTEQPSQEVRMNPVVQSEPNFELESSRFRRFRRAPYYYERIDSNKEVYHSLTNEEKQQEPKHSEEYHYEHGSEKSDDNLQNAKDTLETQLGFKKHASEISNTDISIETPIPMGTWAQISNLPVYRRTKYLRPTEWNCEVFITSVVIDNIYATVTGNSYRQKLLYSSSEESEIKALQEKITQDKKSPKESMTTVEEYGFKNLKDANVFVQRDIIHNLQDSASSTSMKHKDIRNFKEIQFSGTSMHNVKDLKKRMNEKLVSTEMKGLGKTWENGLGEELSTTMTIQFDVSDMLRDAARIIELNRDRRIPFQIHPGMSERYAFESRIIWECQRYLNRELTRQFRTFNEVPGNLSPDSVTLFQFQLGILTVLSFPSLMTNLTRTAKRKRGEPSLYLDIQPLLTPDLVTVRISFCNGFGSIKIELTDLHLHNRILAIQKDNDSSTGKLFLGEVIWKPASESTKRTCINWSEWFSACDGRMKFFSALTGESQISQFPAPPYAITNETENIQKTQTLSSMPQLKLPLSQYRSVVTTETY